MTKFKKLAENPFRFILTVYERFIGENNAFFLVFFLVITLSYRDGSSFILYGGINLFS